MVSPSNNTNGFEKHNCMIPFAHNIPQNLVLIISGRVFHLPNKKQQTILGGAHTGGEYTAHITRYTPLQ